MVYTKKRSSIEPHWSNPKTFFLASDQWNDPYILDDKEMHHLLRVLRIQKGEEIRLLDGRGREGIFLVKEIKKKYVILSHIDDWMHPKPLHKVILAAGWTKAARRGWILEKAVELEAWSIWFWQAEFSQYPLSKAYKESWKSQIIAGAKQCRNPWFPKIKTFPQGIQAVIEYADTIQDASRLVFVEDRSGPTKIFTLDLLNKSGVTICVIGPEGGFAVHEIELLKKANFLPITLGNRVLRWETAAVLCLGLYWWNSQLEYNTL